jgi:hypothetical protein
MAIFVVGMKCPLCDRVIEAGQVCFATSGVWLSQDDPLVRFCDAGVHWSCYEAWPERRRFAQSYVDFWVEQEHNDLGCERAYLDDEVFVSIRPSPYIRQVTVHLYETGSRRQIPFDAWAAFVAPPEGEAEALPPLEASALASARARLARAVPTLEALLLAVDPARKQALRKAYEARQNAERTARIERQARERERKAALKAETEALHREAVDKGLACPKCGVESRDYRLNDVGRDRLYLVCRRCGRSFDQRDRPA